MLEERELYSNLEYCWQISLNIIFAPYKVRYFDAKDENIYKFLATPSLLKNFGVIFLQLFFPYENPANFALLSALVKKAKGIPVYVTLVDETPEIEPEIIKCGAEGVIVNGVEPEELTTALEQVKLLIEKRR